MTDEKGFDADMPVLGVIRKLLLTALPADLRATAFDLAERVAEHPDVEPLADKVWGDLSESEGNVIAREVGIVARDVTLGAGVATTSGEHLH